MSAPRGIPTSRAYWELQAEKLMNRIFEPVETIDLEPHPEVAAPPSEDVTAPSPQGQQSPAGQPPRQPATATPRWQRARRPRPQEAAVAPPADAVAFSPEPVAEPGMGGRFGRQPLTEQPLMLLAVFAAAGLVTATSGVLALSQWNRFQDSLQQERNMLLVERLRNFGPAAATPTVTPPAPTLTPPAVATAGAAASSSAVTGGQGDDQALPPPPPQEPWIEQLGELPRPQASPAPLRVPVSPRLAAATREGSPTRRMPPPGPLPLLVGVVGSPGRVGSAIFQMGGATSTVSVGDPIGNSGWRLRSTDGEGVLIESGGDVRRLSIGSGG